MLLKPSALTRARWPGARCRVEAPSPGQARLNPCIPYIHFAPEWLQR